jgi:hypothetical protein
MLEAPDDVSRSAQSLHLMHTSSSCEGFLESEKRRPVEPTEATLDRPGQQRCTRDGPLPSAAKPYPRLSIDTPTADHAALATGAITQSITYP